MRERKGPANALLPLPGMYEGPPGSEWGWRGERVREHTLSQDQRRNRGRHSSPSRAEGLGGYSCRNGEGLMHFKQRNDIIWLCSFKSVRPASVVKIHCRDEGGSSSPGRTEGWTLVAVAGMWRGWICDVFSRRSQEGFRTD